MVNYQDAKIYKLVGGGLTYYGSTCSELRYRLYKHKQKSNKCKSKLLFDSGDKVEIILVEKYPCNDKMELQQKERYYIENNECVNKYIPSRTKPEYREDNKDKIKEYYEANKDKIKEYYEDNKDKIKTREKEYYEVNKDKIKDKKKEYYEINKEKIKAREKEYYEINKEKIIERKKKYNKDKNKKLNF